MEHSEVPAWSPGHGQLLQSSAPGVTFRKKRTAEICDFFSWFLSCLVWKVLVGKKNVSDTSVFSTILQKKNLTSSFCAEEAWIENNLKCTSPDGTLV